MTGASLDERFAALDRTKGNFGPNAAAQTEKLLAQLAGQRCRDAESLIHFHEVLSFLRAYPQSEKVLRISQRLLNSFSQRVAELRSTGVDLSRLDDGEVSGIAGTTVEETFSYDIARWLLKHHPKEIRVDWDNYQCPAPAAALLAGSLPLLHEDSLVEANVPYVNWLAAASGGRTHNLPWILERCQQLPLSEEERGAVYDSLEIPIQWELGDSHASRTRNRLPARNFFYQGEPLMRREHRCSEEELASPPLEIEMLSCAEGQAVLDAARAGHAVRHRESYAFTHGDARHILRADVGRGLEMFVCQLPPERRLPLRAYHGFLFSKNGVPIGSGDVVTLFERAEVAFNVYYTFRGGESGWLYARWLRLLQQFLGVGYFSVEPFQLGFENDEAIESGAFWFYRKLGFRPLEPELIKLVEAEEQKVAGKPGHKASPRLLRRLSTGHMIYHTPAVRLNEWRGFHVRNIGYAVQRRLAESFGGDADKIREASAEEMRRLLNLPACAQNSVEQKIFDSLALVLALIPDLASWTGAEKEKLAEVISAKMEPEELRYVALLQAHGRLRREILKLGVERNHGRCSPDA